MSTDEKLKTSLRNLERAYARLQEAVRVPDADTLAIDGTIQRFEFVIELFWKTCKRALVVEGIEAGTPKEVLGKAYQAGWLEHEALWLEMLRDRNETPHIYDETKAKEIYSRIKRYVPELQRAIEVIWQRA